MLFEIFKILEEINKNKFKTTINWYHEKEDEDFKIEAEYLISNLDLNLTFVEINQFE